MIKAVIFDIDGVLLDSVRANAQFFRDVLGTFGYHGPSDEEYRQIYHFSMTQVIEKYAPDASQSERKKIWGFARNYPIRMDLLAMQPGAAETVNRLHQQYQLGLLSNRVHKGIDDFYNFSGLQKFFSAVAAYEDTEKHKPDPEPLFFVLNALGVQPHESVYVGDALTDVQCGQAAGVPVIAYGTDLSGAVAVVKDLRQLPDVIAKM